MLLGSGVLVQSRSGSVVCALLPALLGRQFLLPGSFDWCLGTFRIGFGIIFMTVLVVVVVVAVAACKVCGALCWRSCAWLAAIERGMGAIGIDGAKTKNPQNF